MAASTYTTDLTTIDDGSGTYTEPTSAILGTLSNADTDNFVQATSCCSKSTGASGAPARAGMGILAGAGQTITTPSCFYAWVFVGGGGLVDTYANGGVRLLVGSSSANYKEWYVLGSDSFPYIGWTCVAVDPSVTADATTGTPTATLQYFGADFNCKINISKGNPMALDAIRHGRTLTILNGDVGSGYATFAACATTNDAINARWGQFQAIPGGYQLQGRLLLGTTATTTVDFRDSNVSIVTAPSLKTAASFNAIEVQHASSRVDWSGVSWTALGTVSRGTFTVTDNADVNITGCSFTQLSTFSLKAATDVLSSIFRFCDTVTAPGSNLSGSKFLTPRVAADTSAVVWDVATDTDGKFDGCEFSKGTNAHHAIEFGTTSPTAMTLRNVAFGTGFNAANANNDSTLHVKRTTGTVTITLVGCTGNISYKTAGATVVLVTSSVTLSVHVQDIITAAAISGANVWVPVTSAAGGRTYDATVTITNAGATATVTHGSDHGLVTNDWVWISGASLQANNGTYQITKTSNTVYTYTMASSPGSNPTGTIKATFVVINGTTDGSGNKSAAMAHLADQPVSGRVRYGAAPYYKTGPVTGTISSTAGLAVTVNMIPDA